MIWSSLLPLSKYCIYRYRQKMWLKRLLFFSSWIQSQTYFYINIMQENASAVPLKFRRWFGIGYCSSQATFLIGVPLGWGSPFEQAGTNVNKLEFEKKCSTTTGTTTTYWSGPSLQVAMLSDFLQIHTMPFRLLNIWQGLPWRKLTENFLLYYCFDCSEVKVLLFLRFLGGGG